MILRGLLHVLLCCSLLGAAPAPHAAAQTAAAQTGAAQTGAAISAPGTVDPGQGFTASVTGAAEGLIEIRGPIGTGAEPRLLGTVPVAAGAAAITAPGEPGSYELRLLGPAGVVLARSTLDVAASPVMLSVAGAVGAGLDNPVTWRGPGGPGDMIQIFDPVTGTVAAEAPALGAPGAENLTVIRAPERFGGYELRYWSGTRRAPLRTLPIVVEEGTTWMRSPVEVFAGETFTVQWFGPGAAELTFQIVDPATDAVLATRAPEDIDGAAVARLTAPEQAGRYRVRVVNPGTGFILDDVPLEVDRK